MSEPVRAGRMFGPWDGTNAISAARDPDVRAADMPEFYADAIRADACMTLGGTGAIAWRDVNGAIRERWSARTLLTIKRKAWALIQARRMDGSGWAEVAP